jgi:uncharacterized protein
MYIQQRNLQNIKKYLQSGKVLIIYGARRVGKTTLIHEYIDGLDEKYIFVSGEDINVQNYLSSQSIEKLKDFIGEHKILIIDEAQYIKNIGINLKMIVDHISDIKIIATGSSSFDMAQNIGEPLTGRQYVLRQYPLSQLELSNFENIVETRSNLESRLVYGSYPEVVTTKDNTLRIEYLNELVNSYLLKDILQFENIRNSEKLKRLLQLIAFQIGKEVSITELGQQLGLGKNTVDRYLDLLEKVFVIYKLPGFSRNLRKEIQKSNRYFFYDLGIRNTLISNFNPLELRNDIGQIWENYIITERFKKHEYNRIFSNKYFWRTYDKKEIDLIEEMNGKLTGYEIKWNKKKSKHAKAWLKAYPESNVEIITKENYLKFIT